jgi:DNA-binding NarL/FixJ family response regulator/rRNA-processing protein FCF1
MAKTANSKTSFFTQPSRSLTDIKDDCIIVLDTNVLLLPYSISEQTIKQILQTYTTLASKKRLFIPAQVVEEFGKNRIHKLTELVDQITRKRDSLQGLYKGKSLLLESLPIYQEVIRIEKEIDELIKRYRKHINELLTSLRQWNEGDPLTVRYKVLFERVIFRFNFNTEEIQKEYEYRVANHIPPGYKDSQKDCGGAGDLIIWKTILEIAKSYKKNIIFVTGDEKSDWWHRAQKQPIYPRQELINEFKQYVGDNFSFYMIRFPEFLNLFGANESLLKEVRIGDISEREVQILELATLHGQTYDEIAKELDLKPGTVRNSLSSVYEKLGVKNKTGAMQKAIEHGLLKPVQSLSGNFSPNLSGQEIRILGLVQQGFNNQEIADSIELDLGTVRNYLANAQNKLKANNRAHAIQKAIEIGILFPT